MALLHILRFITRHPLTKGRPIEAFLRFCIWQIQSRLSQTPVVKPFAGNTQLWMRRGWAGVTGNLYTGLHEYEDMAFLLHFLRKEDVFVDVGANMGSYTVLAAGVCGANTISLEPLPATFERLLENIRLNHLQELVNPLNAAAGESSSELLFTTAEDTTNHIATETDRETISVPVVPLDSILEQYPSLIKIDVEGYETAVLRGARQTLQHPNLKALIIELNGSGERYGFDESSIHRKLINLGFQACRYEPATRLLEKISSPGTHNTLYCRDLDYVTQRLQSATPFTVLNKTI